MTARKGSSSENFASIIDSIRSVVKHEADTLVGLLPAVGEPHARAVSLILGALEKQGKVLVTGVGKSGIIANKIAATMSSTGTPAVFLHATDGIHGDLGMVRSGDVAIAIAKSGESEELISLVSALKHLEVPVIAITANPASTLATHSDVVLHTPVTRESCPLDLAPTASSTAALAIGDALAITLMKIRDFRAEDFARFHPGGKLGKRLLLRVQDVMIPAEKCPILDPGKATIEDVIIALSSYGLGVVLFSNGNRALDGILTDGDIRRLLNSHRAGIFELAVASTLNRAPLCVPKAWKAVDALRFMEQHQPKPLNVIPVVESEESRKIVGIARLHEFIAAV